MNYNYLNKNTTHSIHKIKRDVSLLLNAFFKSHHSFIDRPIYGWDKNQWKITVYYFNSTFQTLQTLPKGLNTSLLKNLHHAISVLCKPYSVDLRIVPLQHSYLNAQIFAEWLSKKISQYRLYDVIDRALRLLVDIIGPIISQQNVLSEVMQGIRCYHSTGNNKPVGGIKVQISGKLTTGSNRPRYTVKTYIRGSLAGTNISYGHHTMVNAIGSFTVKVWISNRTRIL